MATTPDIQFVCFDLGRVLVRLVDGWKHASDLADIAAPPTPWSLELRQHVSEANRRYETGDLTCDAFHRTAAAHIGCDPTHIHAIYTQWLRDPFPGVAELIDELTTSGGGVGATGCLSNTNAHHWSQMMTEPRFAPLQKLRHPFASHLIGAAKPDPRIYLHVEERLQLPGAAIVFFDDLRENVEAAAARGWNAHQIDTAADPVPQIRQVLRHHGVI